MRRILAIIPARGGSKGIYKKNIIKVCEIPLIAYTIKAALESSVFAKVLVSSDDEEIKEVSLRFSTEVLDRPQELAQDNSSSLDVIEHALKSVEAESYTHFALLQPTSPLRDSTHIKEAFKEYFIKDAESLVSVCEAKIPPQKMLVEVNGEILPLTKWEDLVQNRQNLPKAYHPNGAIYISKVESFLKTKSLFNKPLSLYIMDEKSSLDIDNKSDLELFRKYVES